MVIPTSVYYDHTSNLLLMVNIDRYFIGKGQIFQRAYKKYMGENPENSDLKVDLYASPKIEYFHTSGIHIFTHNDS